MHTLQLLHVLGDVQGGLQPTQSTAAVSFVAAHSIPCSMCGCVPAAG